MLKMLQIGKLIQFAIAAMVLLAIWQYYNGDPAAIAAKAVSIVQGGAVFLTDIVHKIQQSTGKH